MKHRFQFELFRWSPRPHGPPPSYVERPAPSQYEVGLRRFTADSDCSVIACAYLCAPVYLAMLANTHTSVHTYIPAYIQHACNLTYVHARMGSCV